MLEMKELNKMSTSDLEKKLAGVKKELFDLNLQKNTSSVEKTHQFKALKKDIARLLTSLNQKQVGN